MHFCDPGTIIKQFKFREGAHVADFGVGSGYYLEALVKRVGPSGRVYALDIQGELLAGLKHIADQREWNTVEILQVDLETKNGSELKGGSLDAVLVANTLFQVEAKDVFVGEIYRVLKESGGKVLCLDWRESFGGIGPQEKDIVSKTDAVELFEKHGFTFDTEIDAGKYHYGLIFKK